MMKNDMHEPVTIDPLVIQEDFFSDTCQNLIDNALKFYPEKQCNIVALITDGYISENTVTPAIKMLAMIETNGSFSRAPISDFLFDKDVVAAVSQIMAEADELEIAMEYAVVRLPLKNIGRYLRCYHMAGATVLSMEYLEGWLENIGDDVLRNPQATPNRAQICTHIVPRKETAHEKVAAVMKAKESWEKFKGAWPLILGSDFSKKIIVNEPYLKTYPSTM